MSARSASILFALGFLTSASAVQSLGTCGAPDPLAYSDCKNQFEEIKFKVASGSVRFLIRKALAAEERTDVRVYFLNNADESIDPEIALPGYTIQWHERLNEQPPKLKRIVNLRVPKPVLMVRVGVQKKDAWVSSMCLAAPGESSDSFAPEDRRPQLCQSYIHEYIRLTPGYGRFSSVPLSETRSAMSIRGPFDGDLSNTKIEIGGRPVEVMAELPGLAVVEPADILGPASITIRETGKPPETLAVRFYRVTLKSSQYLSPKGFGVTLHLDGLTDVLRPVLIRFNLQKRLTDVEYDPQSRGLRALDVLAFPRLRRSPGFIVNPPITAEGCDLDLFFRWRHAPAEPPSETKMREAALTLLSTPHLSYAGRAADFKPVAIQSVLEWSNDNQVVVEPRGRDWIASEISSHYPDINEWHSDRLETMPELDDFVRFLVRSYLYRLRDKVQPQGKSAAGGFKLAFAGDSPARPILSWQDIQRNPIIRAIQAEIRRPWTQLAEIEIRSQPDGLRFSLVGESPVEKGRDKTNNHVQVRPGTHKIEARGTGTIDGKFQTIVIPPFTFDVPCTGPQLGFVLLSLGGSKSDIPLAACGDLAANRRRP